MIREVILNSFASRLSKKDRDGLNSAVRSIIANPKTFLDNLVYDMGFNKIGVTSLFFNKCRGQKPFNLADVKTDIPFFQARHNEKERVTLNDLRKVDGYDPIPSKSNYDEYSPYRNTKKRKVSKVKFANPELIFLTIQATDKYLFNIFIDDDLGKRYLEKAMAVVSLHYEDWEV